MAKQLFGTDGIRGVAGEFPLDPATAYAVGLALGEWVTEHGDQPVVIGMDTRESGPWLASHVAGGLARAGATSRFAGVVTTPGIAHLTRSDDFVAGVMISASHNPYQDNGIKVFDHSGYKLADEVEHQLEQEILRILDLGVQPEPAAVREEEELDREYLEYLASTSGSLAGLSMVVDCGHGAASHLAPRLFERLGARVEALNCSPDGRNINLDSGALYPDGLARRVVDARASFGVAFDGDADRAILVAPSGQIVNGDAVLFVCGRSLLRQNRLGGANGRPVIVATVMSNLGLERAVESWGVEFVRTPVGDKYVLEEMVRRNAALGGEQSGHVIFREFAATGDGLLTALRVLEVICSTASDLDTLTKDLAIFPQRLVNVRVASKRPLEDLPGVQQEIRVASETMGESGRVLVRFSGTEPLARVMVEAQDPGQVDLFSGRIADAIRAELGSA